MRGSAFGLGWRFLKLLLSYVLRIHSALSFVLGIQYKALLRSADARSFPIVRSRVSLHNVAEETMYHFLQCSATLGECSLWSRKHQVCFVLPSLVTLRTRSCKPHEFRVTFCYLEGPL